MRQLTGPYAPRRALRTRRQNRRGAIVVLILLLLPVMLTLAAFSMNVAHMDLGRTELRVSADSAARAGGRTFALTRDTAIASTAARTAAAKNRVAGDPLLLANPDIEFGFADRVSIATRYSFLTAASNPNSMRVTGRRMQGAPSGPIPLLFPYMLNSQVFETQQSSISTQVEVDVAIVLDRSGSMAYGATESVNWPTLPSSAPSGWNFCDEAPPDCRWRDAVAAVNAFITEMNNSPQDELLSVCTYTSSAVVDQNLTSNYSGIPNALDPYTQSFCSGGTNIGGGIQAGQNALAGPNSRLWAARVIVVMTDGMHNTGTDPVVAATDAADNGIMVFAVTFSDEADQSRMQDVADAGTGAHFHASTGADLIYVFQEIARRLPTLLTY